MMNKKEKEITKKCIQNLEFNHKNLIEEDAWIFIKLILVKLK